MPWLVLTQYWIMTAVAVIVLAIDAWALLNAVRFRGEAYTAADKRTKGFWVALTAVATLLGVLGLPLLGGSSLSIFSIIGVTAAGVFLADVLPALRRITGGGHRGGQLYRGF